jgi:tetratricopeptide (TPR) repeat protein
MRTVCVMLFCLLCAVLSFGEVNDNELLETARLGSATYNISIQFLQDEMSELTPKERQEKIKVLTDKYSKKDLTPLQTLDLLRLLNREKREDEGKRIAEEFSSSLERILEKNPKDHEALIAKMELDQWYGERTLLNTLLADTTIPDSTYRVILIELIDAHLAYGNFKNAEKVADHILRFDSLDTEVLVRKTLIRSTSWLFRLLNTDLELFVEELSKVPEEEQMGMVISRIEAVFDSIDFSHVHKALKMDPENFQYNCFIGSMQGFIVYLHYVMMMSSGREEKEIPALDPEEVKCLPVIKSYLDTAFENRPSGDVDVYMALAMYYLVLLDFENARKYAEEAIDARPDIDQTYDALITIVNFEKILVKDDEEAGIAEAKSILERKRKNMSLTMIDRLMFLHPLLLDNQYEKSLEGLSKIEKDFPDEGSVLKLFRGGILLRMGKISKALPILEDALSSDQENGDILYNLGLAYFVKKDFDRSLEYLNKALQVDPSDGEVQDLLQELKSEQK